MTKSITDGDGVAVVEALNRVEQFLGAHRSELHPQFAHFLERRSYAKALNWLEAGKPAAKGIGKIGDVA